MTDDAPEPELPELRTFRVDITALRGDRLSVGDLIDICEAAEVSPDDLLPMIADPRQGTRRVRALVALAWIIYRKTEPGLTLADVMDSRIVVGGPKGDGADGDANPTLPGGAPTPPEPGTP